MMNDKNNCRICSSDKLNDFTAKEMMFGTGEAFVYQECQDCKSIQIKQIPEDLGKYYAENYYSFTKPVNVEQSWLKSKLKKIFAKSFLDNPNQLIAKIFGKAFGYGPIEYFNLLKLDINDHILDVGCGNGFRLAGISKYGFTNLTGVDPFLKEPITYSNGLHIYNDPLEDFTGSYDLIMLHHVFEHMPNPKKSLIKLKSLLSEKGKLLITIPVADNYLWKHYGTDWIALDPPRHLHLFSEEAFIEFCENAGLKVLRSIHLTNKSEFLASEQLKKGIYLRDSDSFYESNGDGVFSEDEANRYETLAKEVNENRDADIVSFHLEIK